METSELYPRHIEPHLRESLADFPVTLVHGPRQCGKTTLARAVGEPAGYAYITFDDEDKLDFAQSDPIGFVNGLPERVILDEVQKVPRLFSSIKRAVDLNRTAGRFILTGSVSVLHVRGLSDSLAGRMSIIRLHPLAQSEMARIKPDFLDRLFSSGFKAHQSDTPGVPTEHIERIVAGGYPAVLNLSGRRRITWYENYIQTLVNLDVFTLARIRSQGDLPQLLALLAASTAQLLNTNKLASSFQLSRPTIKGHVNLLERLFLLEKVPAWHVNRRKRFVKTPKLHLGDTGLACALLGVNAAGLSADRPLLGRLLETFVFQELKRQASGHECRHKFFHYRDKDAVEVDIVIERSVNAVAGVEVKLSSTVNASDLRGLRRLKSDLGKKFVAGVLLYNGTYSGSFGDRLYVVPVRALWGQP